LVKMMEETFGVSAAAAAVAAAPAAGSAAGGVAAAGGGKEGFEVVLTGMSDTGKKKGVIKAVRGVNLLGLEKGKALVEASSTAVKEGGPKDEAEAVKKKLTDGGATVELK